MSKKAMLTIVTRQGDEDLTFTTRTDCKETETGLELAYEENLSEEDTVNTCMTIGSDSIMVQRAGGMGGDMFFRKTSTYDTQYRVLGGLSLDMRIFTTELSIDRMESGVKARVDYELFIGGATVGDLGLDIKVDYL